ncbi:MAG: GNAT family N-acetyltransferase [Bacteroidia bacterium]|nr:GNAT family N-acetyltransferase [Bacteroidia bacterium]
MQDIIPPVALALIEKELTKDRFVRITNNGSNHLYIVNQHNAPNVLREIGRLREISFRDAGGGTGLDCDLDTFDTCEKCYEQLIAWNPEEKEIMGGYRFIRCGDTDKNEEGIYELATAELFHFSEKFIRDYLPYTIELGRSFVQPKYQPRPENRKGLFTLDNLWDGLGAIHVDHPDIRYFFGKVTMYPHFNTEARDMILHFMQHYFPDPEHLVTPLHPLPILHDMRSFEAELQELPYKEGHKILNHHVRARGENIPPLVNAYMNLSATMRTFGTSLNDHFGEVEETGILVTLADIYETKKERHVNTYVKSGA